MEKLRCLLLVTLLLCSLFIPIDFSLADEIGEHEANSGTTQGVIIANSGLYTGIHWDTAGSENEHPWGITTDETYIWIVDYLDDKVYKYQMDGTYVNSWSTSGETTDTYGITTDGTNIWIVDNWGFIESHHVYKYDMDGTYTDVHWDTAGSGNADPYGITTNASYIWITDLSDAEVYKYDMDGTYTDVHWDTAESGNEHPRGITTDGNYFWITDDDDDEVYKYQMDGTYTDVHWDVASETTYPFGITTDGTNIWIVDWLGDEVYKYITSPSFNVTRTIGNGADESNKLLSFNPTINYTGNVILKVPVSTSVVGIINVTNNTCSTTATEVNTSDELVNNTFWYDSANQFVHIRTIDLTTSTTVNWTVNCTYGVTFNLYIPPYLEVGQYCSIRGMIEDADGNALSGMIARTRVLYQNGTDAMPDVTLKWNCTGGNYQCDFSTCPFVPGIYSISIEFVDSASGITYKEGGTLYLSVDPSEGTYVSTFLHFTFYNSNTGIGIPSESFKIYASTDTTIDSTDRIYADFYNVYTGQTIYYRVDDYFDNQIYPTSGDYESIEITSTEQFEDISIDWYSFSVKNMNHSIVRFTIQDYSVSGGLLADDFEDDAEGADPVSDWYTYSEDADIGKINTSQAHGGTKSHQYNWSSPTLENSRFIFSDSYNYSYFNFWFYAESAHKYNTIFIYNESTYLFYIHLGDGNDGTVLKAGGAITGFEYTLNEWWFLNFSFNYTTYQVRLYLTNGTSTFSQWYTMSNNKDGFDRAIFTVTSASESHILFDDFSLYREEEIVPGQRTYSQYLYPYEPFYWNVLEGTYTINLTYYNPISDAVVGYHQENIAITDDTYYWIPGYDLQDIILEIILVNTSVDSLSISITTDLTAINSTVNTITTNILSSLTLSESNITTLINSYASNYTIIESIINHLNNTIWANFTIVESTIDTINNKLTIDFGILNATIDYINNTVWTSFSTVNSNINTVTVNLRSSLTFTESNLTTLNNNIWNALNITDAVVDNLNNNIWTNLTVIDTVIDNLNNNIWTNLTLINTNIGNMDVSIHSSISLLESNLTSLSTNIWNAINITDSVVDYLNLKIWNNFTDINNNISYVNASITYVNDTVWNNFTIIGENITHVNLSIHNAIDLSEQALTSLNINVWNSLNLTDAIIGYLNNTMWTNFTLIDTVVDTINNKLTVDFDMLNVTIDYINNTVWTEFNTVNTNIGNVETNVITQVVLSESNIATLNSGIWSSLNITDSVVDNLNNNIWSNLTIIDTVVDTINSNIDMSLSTINTNIDSVETNIIADIDIAESNINTFTSNVWAALNITDSVVDTINSKINIDLSMLNVTVDYINSSIWSNFTVIESDIAALEFDVSVNYDIINTSIDTMEVNVRSAITLTESNLTTLNNNIFNSINIVDSILDYVNNTIWNELTAIDTVIDNLNNNIWTNLTLIESDVGTLTTSIHSSLSLVESNLTTLNNNIWNAINISDSVVSYINNTLWNEISLIDVIVDYINNTIWTEFTVISSDIGSISTSIHSSITASESNITAINNNIRSSINITDSMITYLNNTIWSNLTLIRTTVDTINNNIWVNLTAIETEIGNIDVSISTSLNLAEANISSIVFSVWNSLNITDSIIDYLNLTVWNNLTAIGNEISSLNISFVNTVTLAENNITSLQLSFWGDINTTLKNRSLVMFNFYNTNDGLGLGWDILRVYIDGVRATDRTYWCWNGTEINVTVKDYYNFTLYNNTFTINAPFESLNLGLTFHSWLFGNKNDDYYMISFLKEGASRWYERGVVPYGEREYMLPSGNYTMRIYDKDWIEIHNSTYVLNRSMVYVIHGRNLSEIIAGQSVIRGQLLELSGTLADALMPDITIVSRNPPMIFSIYDKEGMAIGSDFYTICPPLITIATTRVTQYGHPITSVPMIPGNGSVLNGTITIIRDVLYLSGPGSITWVNITYTDNGTVMGNTSYIPSRIDIYGQNLTINASGDISVIRETKYNQVKKFDWMYYPFAGYGPDLSRAGWHSAGIEVINPMSVPLYEVYVIAGFSDESNPDGNSVVVSDTTNGGIILERGPDYDVTDTSIHFNLLSMDANEIRAFTIGYYKTSAESYTYDEGTVSIPTYSHTVWNGDSYNTFKVHWNNPYANTFRGALYIKLNFDVPIGIDTTSMRIYDLTFDHELDPAMFIPGDKYIRISAEAMGDVLPGAGRQFDVYFLMEEYVGADPKEFTLNTQIWMGITPFLIAFLAGVVFLIIGVYFAISDRKEQKDRWKACVALGIFIMVVFYILAAMGL